MRFSKWYQSSVPIFTRILDFKRDLLARLRNKRRHPRHRVGVGFPLKASLSLVGSERFNPDRPPGNVGMNWSGVVGNISCSGLSILLSPAATTVRGESSRLRLTLENHEFSMTCHVKHFRVYNSYAVCGVELEFDDFKIQKTYLQLVEAVNLGASFVSAGPGRRQAGLASRSWRSASRTVLTEWREADTQAINRFELNFGEHTVQGHGDSSSLTVRRRGNRTKPVPLEIEVEVRQLFRWIVGNLPKGVPADLRNLMTRASGDPLAAPAPTTPGSPVTASASAAIPAPSPAWQAPKAKAVASPG